MGPSIRTIQCRTRVRVALLKGNNGFQKFGRTIRTKITCVTEMKEMHSVTMKYLH
jgi:hypothetical protein